MKCTLSMQKRPIGEIVEAFVNGEDKLLNELVLRKNELTGEDTVKVFVACKSKTNRRMFWPVVMNRESKISGDGMMTIVYADSNGNSLGHYGRQTKRILEARVDNKKRNQEQLRGRKVLRRAGVAA